MPLIIPAVIAGVGSVAGAAISAGAANHASNVAANAAAQNNALQSQIYDSNKALIQPTVDRGNQAADALQGFLGLGGDPAKTKAAFDNYLNSTGYDFTRQQGIDAAEQSASASGLLNSGAALKALQDRGTGLAQQYGQQYVGNLNDVANRGVQGVNALTGAGTNYANQTSSNNNNAASISANAGIASAASTNALIGQAVNAFSTTRGASSFGSGSGGATSGNAFNQPRYAPFYNGR